MLVASAPVQLLVQLCTCWVDHSWQMQRVIARILLNPQHGHLEYWCRIKNVIFDICLKSNHHIGFNLTTNLFNSLIKRIGIEPPCSKMSMDHANIASYMFKADPVCVIAWLCSMRKNERFWGIDSLCVRKRKRVFLFVVYVYWK